jgi:hypothetical protein
MNFHSSRVNLIEDDSGSSIRILGPTDLDVMFEGNRYTIDSEMLNPPMSLVIYTRSLSAAAGDDAPRLLAFIRAGLEWNGFYVETISP